MAERVKIEGLKEVQKALRELPKSTAKNVMRRILRARAQPIADAAKDRVPVAQGDLKNSIAVSTKLSRRQKAKHRKANPHDVEVFVGPGTHPQAHMQEFGTSQFPAQPFMRPAWDSERKNVLTGIAGDLWKEIGKAAQRLARKAQRLAIKAKG